MKNEIINENVKIVKMWINFECTLWTVLKRKMRLWDTARFILCSFLWNYLSIPLGAFQKPPVSSFTCVRPQVTAWKLPRQTPYSRHWCSQYDLSSVWFFFKDPNEILHISFSVLCNIFMKLYIQIIYYYRFLSCIKKAGVWDHQIVSNMLAQCYVTDVIACFQTTVHNVSPLIWLHHKKLDVINNIIGLCSLIPPTSSEVKETWIYTSTPPYVFMM
jgi:hypothetical protein